MCIRDSHGAAHGPQRPAPHGLCAEHRLQNGHIHAQDGACLLYTSLFFMGTHIVPECKMSPDIVPIVRLKNMNLMGSLVTTFAKIASARYSKFTEIFTTQV